MASTEGLPDALEPVGLLEELFGEATANARRRILPVLVHGKRLGEGKCGRTSTTKSPRGTNGNVHNMRISIDAARHSRRIESSSRQ